MKILIVDDDDIALSIMKKILEKESYEVVCVDNGEAALEILRTGDIQIVVSDWNMPNYTGIELCRSVRAAHSIGYVYFILATGRNSKEDLVEGLSAGADEFISKPFEPIELLLRVRNAERVLALETASMMLFSLAKLAESKDIEIGNHLDRVRAYAQILAIRISRDPAIRSKLPTHFSDLIFQTSPMHDIGKVGIPDYILLKNGSLNDDEWQVMKRHTEIGAETLNACLQLNPKAEFLRIARDIALSHHERWDGTGYPNGLKGEDIPLSARIVTLADVYDALVGKRCYKAAVPHNVAREIIREGTGKQFDPLIVDAFLADEDKFIEIIRSNPELL